MSNGKDISTRAQVIALERGQSIAFAVRPGLYSTLRGYASELSLLYLRRYRTHIDRRLRLVHITREK